MAKKKKNTAAIVVFSLFTVLLLLVGGAYLGVAYYFKTHFYPNSSINGIGVSLWTGEAANEAVKTEAEDFIIAIHDREDRVTYIDGGDIDYAYEDEGGVGKLLEEQNSLMWFKYIGGSHDYTMEVKTSYDEQKLALMVEEMDCFKEENIVEPKDAYMDYVDGEYVIVPEVMGSKPMVDAVLAEVVNAITDGTSVLTLSDEDYAAPAILADDPSLTEKMDLVNRYREMTITYDIEGSEQVLDGDTIVSWITFNEDFSITIDKDKVANYAQQLAYKYNTYAAKRDFKTSEGDSIKIGGGDYGWIVNKSAEADQIVEDIENGESVTRQPVWEQKAFVSGADDIGDTYVEIDYTNQHLYYYKDGQLMIDDDIVSGCLNDGNGSPDGVFKVITRQSPATLVGEDYSSDVTYFMPIAYNVGLHDADWRSSFGGNIYRDGGSHGCINLPYDTAEYLYQNLEIGTPVIAYYRESVRLTSNNARVSNAYSYYSE